MTYYRTLGPVTYTQGNTVISVAQGAKIDLTNDQANALVGQVVLDSSNQFTFPLGPTLFYDYAVLFPAQGQKQMVYFAYDTALFYYWSDISNVYVPVGESAAAASVDSDARDDLAVGESTMSRRYITGTATVPDGTLVFSYFTARKSEAITQLKTLSGSQAQVGATLCRMGLYNVDDAGNLTLAASVASDATLWAAANTSYASIMSSSYNTVRGNRYAVGVLTYGATTPASLVGSTAIPAAASILTPALGSKVNGLQDLPNSVVVANLQPTGFIPYAVVLP